MPALCLWQAAKPTYWCLAQSESAPCHRQTHARRTVQALHLEECKDLTSLALEPVALQALALGGCPKLQMLRLAAPQLRHLDMQCALLRMQIARPPALACTCAHSQRVVHCRPTAPQSSLVWTDCCVRGCCSLLHRHLDRPDRSWGPQL